jgi:hypothetical protein
VIDTRKKPQDRGSTREIIVSSIQKYIAAKFAALIADGNGYWQDFCWTRFLEIVKTIIIFLYPKANLVSWNFWTT